MTEPVSERTPVVGARLFAWLGLYALVCAAALIWPVYPWVMARTPKLWFGLPAGLVWNLVWVLATFLVLLRVHLGYQKALAGSQREGAPR